jgi:hypothetical protein
MDAPNNIAEGTAIFWVKLLGTMNPSYRISCTVVETCSSFEEQLITAISTCFDSITLMNSDCEPTKTIATPSAFKMPLRTTSLALFESAPKNSPSDTNNATSKILQYCEQNRDYCGNNPFLRVQTPNTTLPNTTALNFMTSTLLLYAAEESLELWSCLSVALSRNSRCCVFLAVVLFCIQSSTLSSKSLRVMGLRRISDMPASNHLASFSFDEVPVRPIIVHLGGKMIES